jgi:hypothetical protein
MGSNTLNTAPLLESLGRHAVKQHMDCARLSNILDVSDKWLKRKIASGEITAVRLDKKILVEIESVNNYLRLHAIKILVVPERD